MTWLAEDHARLERFRAGNPEALTEVYRHYVERVARALALGFSFKSGDSFMRFHGYRAPFELDDAVQETFERAFREGARLQYDGLRSYQAYLLTIARHLVIDRFRRAARRPEQFSDGDPDRLDDDTLVDARPETPEETVSREQLKALYERFKTNLSIEDRALVELRFESNEPRAKVSEQTGLTPMQVRTREKKLRVALYERLVAAGYEQVLATTLAMWLLASAKVGALWN